MRAACGRADQMRALALGGPEKLAVVAGLLGYEALAETPEALLVEQPPLRPPELLEVEPESTAGAAGQGQADFPFWRLENREPLPQRDSPDQDAPPPGPDIGSRPALEPARHEPLSTWRALLSRLRHAVATPTEGRSPDIDAIVRNISEGRLLDRLPRRRHLRWGSRVQIIVDRSDRMIPYWRDQDLVAPRLARLFPRNGVEYAGFWEGLAEPVLFAADGRREAYRQPPAGTLVVILGDLGCLSIAPGPVAASWADLGRRLHTAGSRLVALMPCPPERWASLPPAPWLRLSWEKAGRPTPQPASPLADRAERLLCLVSPAIRIEPGFLRGVRLLLSPDEADAGTEADVWQHSAVISAHSVAATLDPDEAKRLRAAFKEVKPAELLRRVLDLLRRWRAGLPQEIWYEELLSLDATVQETCIDRRDVEAAQRFFQEIGRGVQRQGGAPEAGDTRAWFRRVERRLTEAAWTDPHVGLSLRRTSWVIHRDDPTWTPPPGLTPGEIPAGASPRRRFHLRQSGREVVAVEGGSDAAVGSLLGQIDSRNGLIQVLPSDPFWLSGTPPAWAREWGTDEYGTWVTFAVEGADGARVVQRLRWIAPGTFLMGSPETEPERDSDEGLRHAVTISKGFWLADTACTQALWQAVMGDNPSQFKGPDRPVEMVSWEDCARFLERINTLLHDLDLRLPSEAEWEYACRAGTTTPFSFGATMTPEQVNYDGNYPYKGGKKGLYRQETVPVASLPANPWGLHEMHGNVWEWCADGQRGYSAEAFTDPLGPAGAVRVLRGGSWDNDARGVRSAYRLARDPGDRDNGDGFRCARVQEGAEPSGAEPRQAQPGRSGAGRQRERRTATDRPGGAAALIRLYGDRHDAGCGLPQAPAVLVRSDCESLTFRQITRPSWAGAIGRDRLGLWTEFSVSLVPAEAAGKKHSWRFWKSEEPAPATAKTVTQRLRWIPPGRFLMGSPETEAGRDDREGPRHEVTISNGFWLFDTPCTQALWQAVMGDNPSRFQSPDRPVEQVSWDDVQRFLKRINEQVPGLDLVLPSEAQWEYACRAGTETAIYTGDIEILGENNAPALDTIAWYGGNSGVEFDLANGGDSSGWPNKQYPHTHAGARPVGLKAPNPWGLYDMLGNVWEWCADGMRTYTADAVTDPVGPIEAGANRVLRGGSWYYDARIVRSASRDAYVPGFRFDLIGFRCARVQESREPGRGPEALKGKEGAASGASPVFLRFFTIPIEGGEEAAEEVNRFLGAHRIVAIDRQFVQDGPNSAWALCVTYVQASSRPQSAQSGKRAKIDYREVLSEPDFALFAKLRALRKEFADREGVPAYALFTNEQLAEMVQRRVRTAAALREIEGIGEGRVGKYGQDFLAILQADSRAETFDGKTT